MTQQDKKELIETINAHTTKAIEGLAIATKKGFDEVHLKLVEATEERGELAERLEYVESAVFRIEHQKARA